VYVLGSSQSVERGGAGTGKRLASTTITPQATQAATIGPHPHHHRHHENKVKTTLLHSILQSALSHFNYFITTKIIITNHYYHHSLPFLVRTWV
jgi:hypothetical protein